MWPGHAARHRVDGEDHLDAARLERRLQLGDGVLALRDREAVAGHDHDLLRVAEQHADVLGARRAHRPVGCRRRAGRRAAAERAEQDARDAATHRRRHRPGEDRSGRPDERARHDEQHVAEHEARRRDREAREGVEQRDHDRHVGAAHGKHEQHAGREPEREQHDREPAGSGDDDGRGRGDRRQQDRAHDAPAARGRPPGGSSSAPAAWRRSRANPRTRSRPRAA